MTGEKRSAANREVYSAYEALHEPGCIVSRPGRPTVAKLRRRDGALRAWARLLGAAVAGGALLYALAWLACAG